MVGGVIASLARDFMEMKLLKLSLCGPGDVDKEIGIAREVVQEWNHLHGEAHGFWVKHQHWSTDSHPEMGDRPQALINRQMLDDSDIVVAIFWTRFGRPTGVANSGTEEEILRAMTLKRRVMVYFSMLESVSAPVDPMQTERLEKFRHEIADKGLIGRFTSRDGFRRLFTQHLAQVLADFKKKIKPSPPPSVSKAKRKSPSRRQPEGVTQSIQGDNNILAGRDVNYYTKPPVTKTVVERRLENLSDSEVKCVHTWIDDLVDGTVGVSRKRAYAMWWSRFQNRFDVVKCEALRSARLGEVADWHKQQRAIQKAGLKTKAPDQWRNERYAAIKAAMRTMNFEKNDYYPEIAARLKMRRPFASLTDLTKTDLQRVYTLVLRDSRARR